MPSPLTLQTAPIATGQTAPRATRSAPPPVRPLPVRRPQERYSGRTRPDPTNRLTRFDLPLDWGTGLHAAVRRAMAGIPFGETRTYGQIAKQVGAPAQAVGQACGANPLPILIPCHRVTGTDWFGGFSAPGGVETKAALLRHEGALLL